jgi:UDP-N-acetylmuramate dehydrogenase
MQFSQSLTSLTSVVRGKVLFGEPMSGHTSFRLGGPADALVFPSDADDVVQTFLFARQNNVPVLVMGSGTNLLVGDLGIRGIVVNTTESFGWCQVDDESIKCGSGFLLNNAVNESVDYSLVGLEFLTRIPGTVGGAVAMNTGTHNLYISRSVQEVGVIPPDGTRQTLNHVQMRFDYRSSIVIQTGALIEWVRFRLRKTEREPLEERISLLARYRTGSQPYNLPNAGCAFRNPPAGYAGKLIEEAGLKGVSVGGIEVSKLHANFLVNTGTNDSKDALNLIELVQKTVYEKFNIRLFPEIRIAGSWSIQTPDL